MSSDTWGWLEFGWDVGHKAPGIRHPSEAVVQIFSTSMPGDEELAWFRQGFVLQRQGKRRPVIKG